MTMGKIHFQNKDIYIKETPYRSKPNVNMNDDMIRVEMRITKKLWRSIKNKIEFSSDEEWISVKDELPKVPHGKHSVSVLVTMVDPIYEEINPGNGSTTESCLYDGKQFKQLCVNGNCGWDFMPTADPITHWKYTPKPVKYKKRRIYNAN